MPTKQRYFFGIVFTLGCLIIFCSSWHWWHWCSIFLCSLISFLASDGELDLLVHLSFGDHSRGSPHLRHNAALTHTDPSCSWQKICLLCVIRCLSLSALGCLLLSFFLSWVEVPPLYWCNGNRQRLVFCSYWNAICYLLLFIPSQFCLPVGVWGCDDQVAGLAWPASNCCIGCVFCLVHLEMLFMLLLFLPHLHSVYSLLFVSSFLFGCGCYDRSDGERKPAFVELRGVRRVLVASYHIPLWERTPSVLLFDSNVLYVWTIICLWCELMSSCWSHVLILAWFRWIHWHASTLFIQWWDARVGFLGTTVCTVYVQYWLHSLNTTISPSCPHIRQLSYRGWYQLNPLRLPFVVSFDLEGPIGSLELRNPWDHALNPTPWVSRLTCVQAHLCHMLIS